MRVIRVSISFEFIQVCLERTPLRFVGECRCLDFRLAAGHYPTVVVTIVLSLSLPPPHLPPTPVSLALRKLEKCQSDRTRGKNVNISRGQIRDSIQAYV